MEIMEPCEPCKKNNQPNCGNEHCHTQEIVDETIWIQDCRVCGVKNEVTWKQAVNDRSPCCGSFKVEVYSKETLEKEQSEREI